MKTAEEWWKEFRQGDTQVAVVTYPDIRKIQADAIRGAVETIRYSDIYDGNLNQLEPALRVAKSLDK